LIALLAISVSSSAAAESPAATSSGCTLEADGRVACSGDFLRALAGGYQDARADAAVCGIRLAECRALLIPPAPAQAPPLDAPLALGVGAAAGALLVAGLGVVVAGGPVELGAGMAAAGGAGLTLGIVAAAW
jgi:hypothetical protein